MKHVCEGYAEAQQILVEGAHLDREKVKTKIIRRFLGLGARFIGTFLILNALTNGTMGRLPWF